MSTSERAMSARRGDAGTPPRAGEMPEHERPISEQFRIVAKNWADADAAASLREELKSTTLEKMKSDIVTAQGPLPDNTATRLAKCSPDWEKYIRAMCADRAKANLLRVQMEYLKMRHREWIGADATARAEMRL